MNEMYRSTIRALAQAVGTGELLKAAIELWSTNRTSDTTALINELYGYTIKLKVCDDISEAKVIAGFMQPTLDQLKKTLEG